MAALLTVLMFRICITVGMGKFKRSISRNAMMEVDLITMDVINSVKWRWWLEWISKEMENYLPF